MKIFRHSLCLLLLSSLACATEYFSGYGSGAQKTYSYERDYTTGWINTLIAQINANPNLTPTDRSNTLQVLDQLTQIAAQPGTSGGFFRSVGGSSGTMLITIEPDYIVDIWHVPGTAYFVSLSLQAPSAPPANRVPTIAWSSAPGSAASGQSYTISARGHDDDGNLVDVRVWKDGVPFAFGGGGNGYDNTSGNATSDTGPRTVTFTAQAIDANGATSSTISHVVTIAAANRAPTIAWASAPTNASSGQSYTISARGRDGDGDLVDVRVWKDGVPFAFGGGGNGYDNTSGNATSDTGPRTVTFTAQAIDANGATSSTITHVVTIAAANRAPTIAWISAPSNAGHQQSYTITARGQDADGNLTQVNVWKAGAPFAFAGGGNGFQGDSGNATSDSGPQTITFTAQAVDSNGATSSTISHTITISGPANQAPTIEWVSAPATANHNQTYTVSARGRDANGNLSQVNVWKRGVPFAFAGGGTGYQGDSGNSTSDSGPQSVTFTAQSVDASGAASPTISHTIAISPPANQAPVVALLSPAGQSITAGTTLTISSRATDADGNLTAHNLDIQRPAGDWNFQGGFASGAPYQGGPVGSPGNSTRTASFTFNDVGTYYVRGAASDGSGWVQSSTVAITVTAPPPSQFTLTTIAGTGGSVSPGGTYNAGTVVSVTAVPAATHDFAGWSGDASGSANPLSVSIDRNKTIRANFSPKLFALTTSTNGGGTVTPGGSYPAGTWVTLSASPDPTYRFNSWNGDASGAAPSVGVYMDRAKSVQALFTAKLAQTIAFAQPADRSPDSPPFPLNASASSGLPVTYSLLSGPATLSSGTVQLTGPGSVTVQAAQAGDANYLPAAPVTQTFNVIGPASIQYQAASRTLLESSRVSGSSPFVIQAP